MRCTLQSVMQAPGIMTANLHCLPDTLALFEKRLSDSSGTYVRVCGQHRAVTFIWTDWFISPLLRIGPGNCFFNDKTAEAPQKV